MKAKLILFLSVFVLLFCVFAFSVNAAPTDEYGAIETSDKIDLSKMAEDDDVYCVLFDGTEYHTYPSRYIVTSSTDLKLDFTYINKAFEKSYTAKSIYRIQIPAHVLVLTNVLSNGKSSVKEVTFPSDKSLTTINWGAFENCPTLEGFTVPNTVTAFPNQNHFSKAKALKYIHFEEPCQLTSLPLNMMLSCTSLEEFIMPTSITTVGANLLTGCHSLKKVVLSPNLINVNNIFRDMIRGRSYDMYMMEIYMNVNYGIESGDINTLFTSDGGDMQRYVIYLTGTKDEAEEFLKRATNSSQLRRANLVPYDPTKTDASQYLGLDPYTTDKVGNGETVDTSRVIVYGYSYCDAFLEGNHENGEAVIYESLLDYGRHSIGCIRKGCTYGNTLRLNPIFKSYGYSYSLYGNSISISQGFGVDYTALEYYNTHSNNKILEFGILASPQNKITNGSAFENGVAKGGVTVINYSNKKHDRFDIKIGGIMKNEKLSNGTYYVDIKVFLCAYFKTNTGVCYISNGQITSTLENAVSYSDLQK